MDVQGEVALSDLASSISPVTPIAGQVFANPLAPQHSQYCTLSALIELVTVLCSTLLYPML